MERILEWSVESCDEAGIDLSEERGDGYLFHE